MTALKWDQVSERTYETGVDHGVLYVADNSGDYPLGVAWNGLVSVTESPSGAASNPKYADNIKYLNLTSAEDFGATIEAFTYPDEFMVCDGTASPAAGVFIGQQGRRSFGLVYRSKIGNDVEGSNYGYKLHLIYGAQAAPSERAYKTINDSPEALTFSWALTTSPVGVTGYSPTAVLTIDSTKVSSANLTALEDVLFGTAGVDPRLPDPDYVISLLDGGSVTEVEVPNPTFNDATDTVTIPAGAGIVWKANGALVVPGSLVIYEDTTITAEPADNYKFAVPSDTDWVFRI